VRAVGEETAGLNFFVEVHSKNLYKLLLVGTVKVTTETIMHKMLRIFCQGGVPT